MTGKWFWIAFIILLVSVSARAEGPDAYGRLPLSFEANLGQTNADVRFLARGSGYGLFLTGTEAVLSLNRQGKSAVLRMKLEGQNQGPRIEGEGSLTAQSHYLIGNHPDGWQGNVSKYSKVRYHDVYPGIDLVYYGHQRQLEYDFVISPDADPNSIRLAFAGGDHIIIDDAGDLVMQTAAGEIRQKKPVAYQEIDGKRQSIEATYVLGDDDRVGFKLASYDHSKPVVIDPVLIYSTYFGGSDTAGTGDMGISIAVDATGNAYVTGHTSSIDFPSSGGFQNASSGELDAFVFKLNAAGTALVYSTYFGGSGTDEGHSIALDGVGNIYIAGHTSSSNFPIAGAFQATRGGNLDAFILKLNNAGTTLLYSTFLGGAEDDRALGIAVDSAGTAYVAGLTSSRNFPLITPFQGIHGGGLADVFVTKLTPSGALTYSTYVGGIGQDQAYGIAIDAFGSAYVAGYTTSTNFPVVNPFQKDIGAGSDDAFLFKLAPNGNALVFSTYLGGISSDNAVRVAVDDAGSAYVTGYTASVNFPVVNAAQPFNVGTYDIFVTKFAPSGSSLVYSTFFGGSDVESGAAIAVDKAGSAYVTGFTTSVDFPAINAFQVRSAGSQNAYIIRLSPDGERITFSTYIGGNGFDGALGLVLDQAENLYITGYSSSTNFPLVNPLQAENAGGDDGFVLKISVKDIMSSFVFGVHSEALGTLTTENNNDVAQFGFAVAQTTSGAPAQSGQSIIDLNSIGAIVTEVAVPPAPLIRDGRLYVQANASTRGVFSLANPSDEIAELFFYITDIEGVSSFVGITTVGPHTQFSQFVTSLGISDTEGALTVSSSIPVAMAGFGTLSNEQSSLILNAARVADLATVDNKPVVIPHFVDGAGWFTEIVLVNTSEERMSGEIRFFGQDGNPLEVTLESTPGSIFSFDVAPRSFQRLNSTGSVNELITVGSIQFVPYPGSNTPSISALFNLIQNGVTVTRTNIDAQLPSKAYRLIAEASGDFDNAEIDSYRTGIAIANPADVPATVQLELRNLVGNPTGFAGSVTIPAKGQFVGYLHQIPGFESVPVPYQGVLRANTTSSAGISILGLRARINERLNYLATVTGPIPENAGTPFGLVFPHIANGAGYTTQFILVGRTDAQSSSGTFAIMDQQGQPLEVTLK
jgi:hypothetical protein